MLLYLIENDHAVDVDGLTWVRSADGSWQQSEAAQGGRVLHLASATKDHQVAEPRRPKTRSA